jgi:hypothetical protein
MVSCHDHKTWTSENRKRARDMITWVVLHAVPFIRKSLCLESTQESLQSGMPGSNNETRGWSVIVLAAISWHSILLVPLLPFMTKLLEGSTWTGWVIWSIPWSRRYFRTTMQLSITTMPHPHSWKCSVMIRRAWRWTSASSLAITVTRFEHHWTTVASFGE